MVVYARAALSRRRRGLGGDGLLSPAATAQQKLFPHVFQLYGDFLLRAVALPIVLASRRAPHLCAF